MAAKIQGVAEQGDVWVGQSMYEHLHISRQRGCVAAVLPDNWAFASARGRSYKLFVIPLMSAPDARAGTSR
jgi:hypothetical protein